LGDGRGVVGNSKPAHEHGEPIAAQSRDQIVSVDRGADPASHRDQQLVAGAVAERVVHRFEVIDIDEQHPKGTPNRRGDRDGLTQRALHLGAVRQLCQRIVDRLVTQAVLERLALGDVAQRQDRSRDLALDRTAEQRLDVDPHRAVAVEQSEVERSARRRVGVLQHASDAVRVVGMNEVRESSPDKAALHGSQQR
jgi:hypothetical protein